MKIAVAAVLAALVAAGSWGLSAESGGEFLGRVVVEWLEDPDGEDREMRVHEPFGFRDWKGVEWWVPAGAVVDGASIPRRLWRLFGPPFVGDYRRASVVHDHFCKTKDRPWRAVHRMFYDGLVAAREPRAKVMYAFVLALGPEWTRIAGAEPGEDRVLTTWPEASEGELSALKEWIEAEDPDPATIERRVLSRAPP